MSDENSEGGREKSNSSFKRNLAGKIGGMGMPMPGMGPPPGLIKKKVPEASEEEKDGQPAVTGEGGNSSNLEEQPEKLTFAERMAKMRAQGGAAPMGMMPMSGFALPSQVKKEQPKPKKEGAAPPPPAAKSAPAEPQKPEKTVEKSLTAAEKLALAIGKPIGGATVPAGGPTKPPGGPVKPPGGPVKPPARPSGTRTPPVQAEPLTAAEKLAAAMAEAKKKRPC